MQGIPPLPRPTILTGLRKRWFVFRLHQRARQRAIDRARPQARFHQLLETASQVAKRNPRGLADLVRAILRPLQSEYLLGVAEHGQDALPRIDAVEFFDEAVRLRLLASDRIDWRRKKSLDPTVFRMNLAQHVVLPCAWDHVRFVSALSSIGCAKRDDGRTAWRQDDNHFVTLWLPWGIGFVGSGNHSITAGILAGEGIVQPTQVYDMGYLLDEIRCDGAYYRDATTNKCLCPVTDVRRAAVFEIGRLMRETDCPAFRESPMA